MLGELSNKVWVYEVEYPKKGRTDIGLKHIQTIWTGVGEKGVAVPSEVTAPVTNHFVVSIRNDNSYTWQGKSSDAIVTFEIDRCTETLSILNLSPSGGKRTRNFSINKNGSLIAVGNQYTVPGRLVAFKRDAESGVYDWENPLSIWATSEAIEDGGSLFMMV